MAITSLQERNIKAQEVKKERPSYWGPLMNMAKIVAQKKMSEEQLRVHTISTIQGIEASDAVRIIDILEHTCSNFVEMDMLGAREAYLYGYYGIPDKLLTEHDFYFTNLSDARQQEIYEIGKKARERQLESQWLKAKRKMDVAQVKVEEATRINHGGAVAKQKVVDEIGINDKVQGRNTPSTYSGHQSSKRTGKDSQDYEESFEYYNRGGSEESWNKLKARVAAIERNPQIAIEKTSDRDIIKLDNQNVREWYVYSVSKIKDNLDKGSFEDRARQAFETRNRIRTTAREMMADEEKRLYLYERRRNPTFEALIESKMKRKNMTRAEAIQDIFDTAIKTNADVNREFGIGGG